MAKDKITKTFGTIFIVSIIFVCLVLLDWIIKKYINLNKFKPVAEAVKIEENHRKTVKESAELKRLEGFRPLFYPRYFNKTKEFHSLYTKYSALPLGGLPNTKYYVCDEGYGMTTFISDKYGFWNSNRTYEKDIDIMIIGDSMSMNGCIQESKSFVGMLKKDFNVMNLSMGSNDPVHYASTAKTFIDKFKPKKIFLILTRGDFIDHYSQKTHIYKNLFFDNNFQYFDTTSSSKSYPDSLNKNLIKLLNESQKLTEKNINQFSKLGPAPKANFLKRFIIFLKTHSKLTYIQHIIFNKKYLPFGNELVINTIDKYCKSGNCEPHIFYVPSSNFWRPDSRQKKHVELLKSSLSEYKNINFHDLTEEFEGFERKGFSPFGSHLSFLGNKIVFEFMLKNLK